MNQESQVDPKDLKIQALVEKIADLTANYENQAADMRVNLTILSQERDELKKAASESSDEVVE